MAIEILTEQGLTFIYDTELHNLKVSNGKRIFDKNLSARYEDTNPAYRDGTYSLKYAKDFHDDMVAFLYGDPIYPDLPEGYRTVAMIKFIRENFRGPKMLPIYVLESDYHVAQNALLGWDVPYSVAPGRKKNTTMVHHSDDQPF